MSLERGRTISAEIKLMYLQEGGETSMEVYHQEVRGHVAGPFQRSDLLLGGPPGGCEAMDLLRGPTTSTEVWLMDL